MLRAKKAIAPRLPEKLKAVLRPWYWKLARRTIFDKPSTRAIGTFGGFEVAYRRDTAEEKVRSQIRGWIIAQKAAT